MVGDPQKPIWLELQDVRAEGLFFSNLSSEWFEHKKQLLLAVKLRRNDGLLIAGVVEYK